MLEFAASLLPFTEALAAPKRSSEAILSTPLYKRMTSKDLVREQNVDGAKRKGTAGKSEVQNNAYSVHAATEPTLNTKPMAGFGQTWAREKRKSSCSTPSCYRLRCAACRAGSDTVARGR